MKNYLYLTRFKTGEFETVWAGCVKTARILAQAEQIKKGNRYAIVCIEKMKD